MKEYKIDYELSKEIYEEYKGLIQLKQCYYNCFKVATSSNKQFDFFNKEIKMGYCYMDIGFVGILVRHCVLITHDDRLIDVTAFASEKKKDDILKRKYFVFETLDDEEVYKMVFDTKYADNKNSNVELREYKEFFSNNIFYQLAEDDFLEYVFPKIIAQKEKKLNVSS